LLDGGAQDPTERNQPGFLFDKRRQVDYSVNDQLNTRG
jgi:hypothetical protein